jgi:lipoate-protein ligase A
MAEWRFIDSGPCTAFYNMAIDEAIAISVRKGVSPPTLRLYGWDRPSVSLGAFQKSADIDSRFCADNDIPVVRRPTGGRGIFHGDELTYSFSSRNEGFFSGGLLDSYGRLSAAFKTALELLGLDVTMKKERIPGATLNRTALCFRSTSYGEISFSAKKLIGSAQKRWRDGLLQQGSLPYDIDEEGTGKIFGLSHSAGLKNSMIGLREALPNLEPEKLKDAIRASFERTFLISFRCSSLSPEEDRLARELEVRKYRSSRWNLQR